jgi:hypothetical protein
MVISRLCSLYVDDLRFAFLGLEYKNKSRRRRCSLLCDAGTSICKARLFCTGRIHNLKTLSDPPLSRRRYNSFILLFRHHCRKLFDPEPTAAFSDLAASLFFFLSLALFHGSQIPKIATMRVAIGMLIPHAKAILSDWFNPLPPADAAFVEPVLDGAGDFVNTVPDERVVDGEALDVEVETVPFADWVPAVGDGVFAATAAEGVSNDDDEFAAVPASMYCCTEIAIVVPTCWQMLFPTEAVLARSVALHTWPTQRADDRRTEVSAQ